MSTSTTTTSLDTTRKGNTTTTAIKTTTKTIEAAKITETTTTTTTTVKPIPKKSDVKGPWKYRLVDITEFKGNKEGMEKRLVDHIKEAIQEQETDGNKIEWLYIGKTYVDKDKRKPFNHMNPENWKTNGIADRWIPHQGNPEIPSDGMVVLCAFTKEHLPDHSRRSQEFLAIAMEQRLIQHFQIFDTERKLVNDSFNQGGTSDHTNESVNTTTSFNAGDTTIIAIDPALNISSRDPPTPNHHAYVLYMTYAYEKKNFSRKIRNSTFISRKQTTKIRNSTSTFISRSEKKTSIAQSTTKST